jgi:hypothetical protein
MRGMGRHTATDGSSVHPLVAEGLVRRGSGSGAHRTVEDQARQARQSGEVGWPAPPNKGHGLGWPGDLPDGEEPAEPEPHGRRGRRRFFGATPAA